MSTYGTFEKITGFISSGDEVAIAEDGMDTKANTVLHLEGEPHTGDPEGLVKMGNGNHRHVAIHWEGGVLWLDMSRQSDHFCIDVRQFNPDGKMKGQGAFTMVNGRRSSLDTGLEDTTGTPVKGHGWNGGYMMVLLTDLHGEEASAIKPSNGNG